MSEARKPHSKFDKVAARAWCRKHDAGGNYPQIWVDSLDAAVDEIERLEEQLEVTRAALQALVDYADGKVGDDFGTTEWNRAREVLGG